MSEYQYYEFQAIDRPLSDADRLALRDLSTRARITATSFTKLVPMGRLQRRSSQAHGTLVRPAPLRRELRLAPPDDQMAGTAGRPRSPRRLCRRSRLRRARSCR